MNLTDKKTIAAANEETPRSPLEISSRLAWIAMVAILLVSLILSVKHIAVFRVASEDASTYYLPLAREVYKGNWERSELPMTPPLYSVVVGMAARPFFWADQPLIVGGQAVNLICFLGSLVCVFLIGRTLYSYRVGIAAAALASVNQWLLKYVASVGPEMLYVLELSAIALLLSLFLRRPGVLLAIAIGALSSLAMLTRSEGMVIFAAAFVAVSAIGLFSSKSRWYKGVACILTMLIVGAAVLLPRMMSMHRMVGSYVHDMRMVPYIDKDIPPLDWCNYPPPGHEGRYVLPEEVGMVADSPTTIAVQSSPPASEIFDTSSLGTNFSEGFLMMFGLQTIFLAIVWFVVPTTIRRNWSGQLVVGSVVISQIAAVIAATMLTFGKGEFSRRYTLPVAGIFQLWGGLGMVAICEWFRWRNNRHLVAIGRSVKNQLFILGGMMLILAIISLAGSSIGTRHAELAELGEFIVKQYGPNKRILASTSQSPFYADGIFVSMRYVKESGMPVSSERLAQLCRDRNIDFIVTCGESWSEQLIVDINERHSLPSDLVVMEKVDGKGEKAERYWLIDARKLSAAIAGR